MIVVEQDTSVLISQYDFNLVLFGFSYIRSLEKTSKIDSKRITRLDSINIYLNEVLSLEHKKHAEQDSVIINLEEVIKKHEKAKKREKLKNVFVQIGAGLVIAVQTGVITYLLLK